MRAMKWPMAVAAATMLLITGCGDDNGSDPYRNAVSDKRAPKVDVTVRDDDGDAVADIVYDATKGPVPIRATYAFLQTLDEGTWSTAYTLSDNQGIIEGVPEGFDDDAHAGPGPDTYPLPDLDADETYRICVPFVVGHPAADAASCSASFHSS